MSSGLSIESWYNRSTLAEHRDTYPFIDPYRFRNALTGKVVLITNAHRGIGRASALDFAGSGARVVCTARTTKLLEPVLSELRKRGSPSAYAFALDAANLPALIEEITKSVGPIDILLNISTGAHLTSFVHTENFDTEWWAVLEDNLRTPLALTHAVLPSMISRGSGTIISTTFRTGVTHIAFSTPFSVAHSAMIRFHHNLDDEVRAKGIYSYVVHPGTVASHLHDPDMQLDPRHFALEPRMRIEKTSKLGRLVEERWCAAGLASGTFLALAADTRARCLSGLYVDAERDLGQLIEEAEKEGGRVAREALYLLKVDEL